LAQGLALCALAFVPTLICSSAPPARLCEPRPLWCEGMGNCCAPTAEDAAENQMTQTSTTENNMSKSQPPATTPTTAPAVKAQPKAAPASSGGSSGGGGNASSDGITFDMVVNDLEKAETLAYGTAFASFGAADGKVPIDSVPLRQFLETNSGCPYEELDTVLLSAASSNPEGEAMHITESQFIGILRQTALPEAMVLEKFMNLTGGESEVVPCEECRTALFFLKNDLGAQATSVREDRWEAVMDAAMSSAEPTVSMEAFRNFCFKEARIANVVHLAKV